MRDIALTVTWIRIIYRFEICTLSLPGVVLLETYQNYGYELPGLAFWSNLSFSSTRYLDQQSTYQRGNRLHSQVDISVTRILSIGNHINRKGIQPRLILKLLPLSSTSLYSCRPEPSNVHGGSEFLTRFKTFLKIPRSLWTSLTRQRSLMESPRFGTNGRRHS